MLHGRGRRKNRRKCSVGLTLAGMQLSRKSCFFFAAQTDFLHKFQNRFFFLDALANPNKEVVRHLHVCFFDCCRVFPVSAMFAYIKDKIRLRCSCHTRDHVRLILCWWDYGAFRNGYVVSHHERKKGILVNLLQRYYCPAHTANWYWNTWSVIWVT